MSIVVATCKQPRAGEIGLEEARAFTLTDDHSAQEEVLGYLSAWNRSPDAIRSALTSEEVASTDKRSRYIGLDTYQDAGGPIRQDLFAENGVADVQDEILLDRLVWEKLKTDTAALREEGWSWTDTRIDFDYSDRAEYGRVYPEPVELSDADRARLAQLTGEYDTLNDQLDGDPENADLEEQRERIADQIEPINDRARAYSSDDMAEAGAIITFSYGDEIEIARGLVNPDTEKARQKAARAATKEAAGIQLSSKLVTDLTAQRTAALGAELACKPDIALAAVVHKLALGLFYPCARGWSCPGITAGHPGVKGALSSPETCCAWQAKPPAFDINVRTPHLSWLVICGTSPNASDEGVQLIVSLIRQLLMGVTTAQDRTSRTSRA